jgi:tripartite-type tricarboxylate transporter receptor subunit TctC
MTWRGSSDEWNCRPARAVPRGYPGAMLYAAIALCAGPTAAQKYPEKPIQLVVPFAPDGGTDVLARSFSSRLAENLGGSIVIENRGGAGGTLGTEIVARAVPDGSTLLFTSASHTFNPGVYSKLRYDSIKDFAPVTLAAMVPLLLVVRPSLPVRNVKELLALAHKRPGDLLYGSAGTGSSVHLAGALLASMAKVNMIHVAYKGGGPAVVGLLSGETSVLFPGLQAALSHAKSGRLRALAVSTAKRSPALPDLPSVAESLPGYDATSWYGMLAPAGTPPGIIARLHAVTVKTLTNPQLKEQLAVAQLILILRSRVIFVHLAVSSRMNLSNSAGVLPTAIAPSSADAPLIEGAMRLCPRRRTARIRARRGSPASPAWLRAPARSSVGGRPRDRLVQLSLNVQRHSQGREKLHPEVRLDADARLVARDVRQRGRSVRKLERRLR